MKEYSVNRLDENERIFTKMGLDQNEWIWNKNSLDQNERILSEQAGPEWKKYFKKRTKKNG